MLPADRPLRRTGDLVWESAGGATFQWSAFGDDLMDLPTYVQELATLCPGVPFLQEDWWKAFPEVRAADIVDFLALCRQGKSIRVDVPAEAMGQQEFDCQHQQAELLKSIAYLRQHCGAGQKESGNRRGSGSAAHANSRMTGRKL